MKKVLRKVREALRRLGREVDADLRLTLDCPVPWADMTPTDQPDRRRCATCDSDVLDLLGKSQTEVVAILKAGGGTLCGQVLAREDGRVVFGSCAADGQRIMRGGLTLGT